MDVSQRDALFARETLWLWLGLFLIVVAVPFSIMRVGPLPSFFFGSGVAAGLFGFGGVYPVFRLPENAHSRRVVLFCRLGDFLGGAGAHHAAYLYWHERHGGVDVCDTGVAVLGVSRLGGAIGRGTGGVGVGRRVAAGRGVASDGGLAAIY